MDSTHHSDVAWLQTLDALGRARFFTKLAHSLTVSGRMIAVTPAPAETRLEQLRQLNEIQHRVVGYLGFALRPDEDLKWLPVVARIVLEPADGDLRKATEWAWKLTREHFAAVP